MLQNKQCSKCGQLKPKQDFNRRTASPDGLRQQCKKCHRAQQSKYSQTPAGKASHARGNRKARYGFYELPYTSCEACGSTERLVADHDHSCCPTAFTCGNCFRGVLCFRCNVAYGMLEDDPVRVAALLAYALAKEGGDANA
jgi:hypothetical protein